MGASERAGTAGCERLSDVEAVRERLDELSFFARDSVWSIQPRTHSPGAARAAEHAERRCRRRGLDLRVVIGGADPVQPGCPGAGVGPLGGGVAVRVSAAPVERLVLVDAHTAVVAEPGGGATVVTAASVVARLCALFEFAWAAAVPAEAGEAGDCGADGTTDAADVELAGLLARGWTDERLARDLGICTRQLRRRTQRLLTHLDTGSRFAAGVAAARHGWV